MVKTQRYYCSPKEEARKNHSQQCYEKSLNCNAPTALESSTNDRTPLFWIGRSALLIIWLTVKNWKQNEGNDSIYCCQSSSRVDNKKRAYRISVPRFYVLCMYVKVPRIGRSDGRTAWKKLNKPSSIPFPLPFTNRNSLVGVEYRSVS